MKALHRCIARLLVICIASLGLPYPATAALIATDQVQASTHGSADRDHIKAFLDRADVKSQLQSFGVDAAAASARVDALSDEEAGALAGRIDKLPAGGADVLGVLLVVFIVLLITDILGVTHVFPFTRSIR